jgi:hypothetical protein
LRQRSSRVDVLFLLAIASLHRVRHRISRVSIAAFRLLGAAAAMTFFNGFVFSSCFLPTTEIRSGSMAD